VSFAAQFREGKKQAQQFEKAAFVACGIAACVLAGFVAVALAIWGMHERKGYFTHHNSPYEAAKIAPRRG